MSASDNFQPLMDEIFRERVLRAQKQSPEEKFVAGLTLFEEALVRMRGGIRAQFPQFTDAEIEAELHRRINRVRKVQQFGFFTDTPRA
jgi:hypothetical protein